MTVRGFLIGLASAAMAVIAAFVMGLWAATILPGAGDLPAVRPASYEPIRLVQHRVDLGGLE